MHHALDIPGFRAGSVALEFPGLLAAPQLMQDGQPAPRGQEPRTFLLRSDEGRTLVAALRSPRVPFDPIPIVAVEGHLFDPAPAFTTSETFVVVLALAFALLLAILVEVRFGCGTTCFFAGWPMSLLGSVTLLRRRWPAAATLAAVAALTLGLDLFVVSLHLGLHALIGF